MTAISETAYPRLLPEPKPRELSERFTPTEEELAWGRRHAATPRKRIGLLILMKCSQRLGYFPALRDVPRAYVDHVTQAGGLARPLTSEELKRIEGAATRNANIRLLRRRMDIRPLAGTDEWLKIQAERTAQTHHQIADIVNVLLEELVHHRYELPGFSTLVRTAKSARDVVDSAHYDLIAKNLDARIRKKIDGLFETPRDASTSAWNALKQEPAKPTNSAVREYLHHIRDLQKLAIDLPPVRIPVAKLRYYRTLARAQNAAEMASMKPNKRYALAVIQIRSCQAKALDDAADLFVRLYDRLESSARKRLHDYQLDRVKVVDQLVARFHDTLLATQVDGDAERRITAIDSTLGDDTKYLLALCEEHLAFANQNHLPFMLNGYPAVRSLLLNCLEIIKPRSTSTVRIVEKLIGVLALLRQSRAEVVSLAELNVDLKSDLAWMSATWRKLVFGLPADGMVAGTVYRKYFELSILQQVRNDLRSGDLYIERGEKYDDYREQLVDRETFANEVGEYGEVTGIKTDAKAFVDQLRGMLTERAAAVDRDFKDNAHASIMEGRLSLRRLEKTTVPKEAEKLDLMIRERLDQISILDVLIDVERWLDLHLSFKPIAGTESRLDDLRRRVVTTLFCYGCNLGASQTSRSVKGINRRQLGWLNLKYVTEEALDKAIVKVTNAYAKFELPNYWGGGKTASADGTKWDLYEQNMLSEYHIRYGGYGGIGYYHVSDKYIALFSRFIPCGVYEGVHILDGLLDNESDIQPDTIHGDTHSQNYAVFAISFLLGIKLMPRIRGIHKLSFFRPSASTKYRNIDDLFDAPINWKLIEAHFDDMLRVVVSIKLGRITASTMLRRFGTTSQKNRLSQAFRELGKVIRTLFLLDYVAGAELRKLINAATNKSESFNNFIQWVFFGGEGIIQENVAHEQRKLIKYSHLVANMVCLRNVQSMSEVIRQLREEGMEITPEMLSFLSPYRTWHINRFGDYVMDFERPSAPMNPGIKIFQ